MPAITETLINRPVWFDFSTGNLDAAKALYGELFGWTFQDSGPAMGHYNMAFRNGQPVSAISPKMPGAEQMPSVWTVYMGVADINATVAAIKANGGQVSFGPMDIPGSGKMAVCTDKGGAHFGLWQADPFPGARLEGEHGSMCWAEAASRDMENAAFYEKVFGLTAHKMEGAHVYWTLHQPSDNAAVAGVMQMDASFGDVPPHWLAYFTVENLDTANEIWKRHGGKVLQGPIPSPYGKIMIVQDAEGAVVAYMAA